MKCLIRICFLAWIPFLSLFSQETEPCKVLVEAGEINISPDLLCVLPHNGIFLLIGNNLVNLDDEEKVSSVCIPDVSHPEDVVFTVNEIYVKDDVNIIACKDKTSVLFLFDTNNFNVLPSTDGNLFVVLKSDSISLLFLCDVEHKEVKPLKRVKDEIIYVSGSSKQYMVVTPHRVYNIQREEVFVLLDYFQSIVSATMTKKGLVFSTDSNILLLSHPNVVAVIGDRGCKRLLSDDNKLYILYDDGALLSYNLSLIY